MSDASGLDLLDDGLEAATRAAFARVYTLPEIALPTGIPLQPLHQELRLAIEIWQITQAGYQADLDRLIGRDNLALARNAAGDTRIVRLV